MNIMNMLRLGAACVAGLAMVACVERGADAAADGSCNGNAAIENIMTRTSIRQFDPDRKINADTVEVLLRAAMAAPTAVNKQPWAFVVVDDRAVLDSLSLASPYSRLETAPMAIVACGDMSLTLEGEAQGFWVCDVSAATENLLLAAHAMGLGAVWTGMYPSVERVANVSHVLGLPESIVPLAVVPVGYPAAEPAPKDKWDPAKVHYNGWSE